MTDVVTPAVRSRMMSGIRGKDTKPEMLVRHFLHRQGLRYRLHDKKLPGTPDLVFPRHGTVVFIHGCYWHRHEGCKYASTPASNVEFWQTKSALGMRPTRCPSGTLLGLAARSHQKRLSKTEGMAGVRPKVRYGIRASCGTRGCQLQRSG